MPMFRWVLGFVAIATLAGCGESTPTVYPVGGQVIYRKKPLAEAVVTFHPKDATGRLLSATTDAEGRFRLTTTVTNDGAPAGEYGVSVALREKRKDGDDEVRNGRNLLPPRYADPKTSGLTATVKPGENTLHPFVLTD